MDLPVLKVMEYPPWGETLEFGKLVVSILCIHEYLVSKDALFSQ